MRRARRMVLNGLTVVSLALCLLAAGLWVRGAYVADWVDDAGARVDGRRAAAWAYHLGSSRGGLLLRVSRSAHTFTGAPPPPPAPGDLPVTAATWRSTEPIDLVAVGRAPAREWRWLGFAYVDSGNTAGPSALVGDAYIGDVVVRCPHWAMVALFALRPGGRLVAGLARRARRRTRPGRCPACGYDLRATPARCPECGAIPAR